MRSVFAKRTEISITRGIDRRRFTRLALAGAGSLLWGGRGLARQVSPVSFPPIKSTFNGVVMGCNSYSLPDLSIDDAIRAMVGIGFGECEIHPRHLEPGFGARSGAARENLRQWRLSVPLEEFEAVGQKFRDAGIFLYAYNFNFQSDVTDGEIERAFEMTRALGAEAMTAVGSNEVFRRLDPFAKKFKMRVGLHNERGIRTPEAFDAVRRGLSDYIAITLDIGHWVAGGADPVDFLSKHHHDIINLHIKDRKRDFGPDMPFGQGDTPIKEVLVMARDGEYGIPANIEWEIAGQDRVEAVRRCFEYCKQVLLS